MSGGHHAKHNLSQSDLDDLLAEVLANPKIKQRLARGFKLVTDYDIALLGSSSIGGWNVYLDRHLKYRNWPYGTIPVNSRKLNVIPGLIRHERLEQAIEDELGWPYMPLAHPIAQHWEEQLYKSQRFDPAAVEKMFGPYIKHDEAERIKRSPTNLDMRPLLSPPKSTKIIARVFETSQREKRRHFAVKYIAKSAMGNQKCSKCVHFIQSMYGGPACEGVQSPIAAGGWCTRYRSGVLGDKPTNG